MARKHIQISYLVSGHVNSDLEIFSKYAHLTAEEIIEKLNSGEWVTTIQEGGAVEIVESGKTVGKVVFVDNYCEYTDFTEY